MLFEESGQGLRNLDKSKFGGVTGDGKGENIGGIYRNGNVGKRLPLGWRWVGKVMPRWSIFKKIAGGYLLAIGVASLGTTVGLAVGDYYQRQAQWELNRADEKRILLLELDRAVMQMLSHPQRLVQVLGESIWFEYEQAQLLSQMNVAQQKLHELEKFIDNQPGNMATESRDVGDLLPAYTITIRAYVELIESWWGQVKPSALQGAEIPAARLQVWELIASKKAIKLGIEFERLSERLNILVAQTRQQQDLAEIQLENAHTLRLLIVAGSVVLSAGIAGIIGFYTSRHISRPIEWVNQVARRVTENSNFQLIAPVLTNDEVGSLAISLNQLIQWLSNYTKELELARQTLEHRVEERTQELKQALQQLQATQSQLVHSEKMSALGQMVGGVAHEINNPVSFIYGNVTHAGEYLEDLLHLIDLYEEHYPTPVPEIAAAIEDMELEFLRADFLKILDSMRSGADRIRTIVLSLRNFSRLDESEVKRADIHSGIDSTLLILNQRLSQIKVGKNYGSLPEIECYPAQLNQLFLHLISNAIDALEEAASQGHFSSESDGQRQPQISIRTEMLSEDPLTIPDEPMYRLSVSAAKSPVPTLTKVPWIRIRISDNGLGIAPDIAKSIFDPFFTTKAPGKGTGMGLAICYQIVQKHGGSIEVISRPGHGAEFVVTMPVSAPNAACPT
ncbi:ATP-binding protein [[Phormidium] sp. ETS-05]|uniref:sensor histidine kinase n=1 Tax=[Phormidium] sp. ETS-05 TaxID=222819 RepID=UPI0018EF0050|nr:ATP-binding protein [[Phormidium] sp. ETS-05]